MLGGVRQGADWVVVIGVVIRNQIIDFSQIHQHSQFSVRFFLREYWTGVL